MTDPVDTYLTSVLLTARPHQIPVLACVHAFHYWTRECAAQRIMGWLTCGRGLGAHEGVGQKCN